jgi:ATP-dependent DNA helicase RecG
MKKYSLHDSVETIKYVGEEKAKLFSENGIATVRDLFNYFPTTYKDTSKVLSVTQVYKEFDKLSVFTQVTQPITFFAKVLSQKFIITRKRRAFVEIVLCDHNDESKKIVSLWFNQSYVAKSLPEGAYALFYGKVAYKNKKLMIVNPEFEISKETRTFVHLGKVTPVYKRVKSISTAFLRRYFNEIKETAGSFNEFFPADTLKNNKLLMLPYAYAGMHYPKDFTEVERGFQRLAIQELIEIREEVENQKKGKSQKGVNLKLSKRQLAQLAGEVIKDLPFKLTMDQESAIEELIVTIDKKEASDTFLYGDVGSGKTVIFAIVASLLVKQGFTVIIMVPTTVLAQQHFQTLQKLLEKHNISVFLSQGGRKKATFEEPGIIVGTHSLLYDKVSIVPQVALIAIDEQHRFGVSQRQELKEKFSLRKEQPHVLSLSATPIPRTLAQSYFGFTESIFIKSKPAARGSIKTKIVPQHKVEEMYEWIAEKTRSGEERAFLLFPIIEESEALPLTALKEIYSILKDKYFRDIPVGMLHGKMKDAEKNEIMDDFKSGKISVLFCTPVIEVGIDVPEATVMVIHDADRFGLAQLHQLRGRVGRGSRNSFCFLIPTNYDDDVNERLKFFESHLDGLDLADFDLKYRGPGEIYGIKQAGIAKLKIADLNNYSLVNTAMNIYKELKARGIEIPRYIRTETYEETK